MKTKAAGAREVKTSAEFIREIRRRMHGAIRENEPMAKHTSFCVGGPADVWTEPQTAEDLFALIEMCDENSVPHIIVGRGTNLLVRDGGIRGVVISLDRACTKVDARPPAITAGAAVSLSALAKAAAKNGLTGLEFCAGIPGSVGGGLVANAGAWGASLCDKLKRALIYDPKKGTPRAVAKAEVAFGYRQSDLAAFGVILEAEFDLERGDSEAISDRMKEYNFQRNESQPVGFKSAGCVFKNPPGGYAGALIDALGFKGYMCGDAMVSDMHANFIVNTGAAGAADILALIAEIKRRALDTSGIELEEEIEVVGEN